MKEVAFIISILFYGGEMKNEYVSDNLPQCKEYAEVMMKNPAVRKTACSKLEVVWEQTKGDVQ